MMCFPGHRGMMSGGTQQDRQAGTGRKGGHTNTSQGSQAIEPPGLLTVKVEETSDIK